MDLAVTQLENTDTITTGIRINREMTIIGLRLRLFKHGTPDGTLTLTLKEGAVTIGTMSLTAATINAAVGTYFHGYVLFETGEQGLSIKVDPTIGYNELSIEISLSGHTDDVNNHISLVKNFDSDAFISNYGNIPSEGSMTPEQLAHFQPYGIEIYKI